MARRVMSPCGVNAKLPSRPLRTCVANRALTIDRRGPFGAPNSVEQDLGRLGGIDGVDVGATADEPAEAPDESRAIAPQRRKRHPGDADGHAVGRGTRQRGALLPAGVAHTQIRSGRPQTNGHVERLHRTILEECWRPAFARYLQVRFSGPAPRPQPLPARLQLRARTPRTQHGRTMPRRPRLRCPQDGAEMSRTRRHNSESVQISRPGATSARRGRPRCRPARTSLGRP